MWCNFEDDLSKPGTPSLPQNNECHTGYISSCPQSVALDIVGFKQI